MTSTEPKIQQAQRAPGGINTKNTTPKQMSNSKGRKPERKNILKSQREENNFTYSRISTRITLAFSSETKQARPWSEIFKVLKGRNTNLEFCYQWNYLQKSRRNENFSDKQKLRGFITGRPALQEILKSSSERRKLIQVRHSNVYKESKRVRGRINEGKIKYAVFLILNWFSRSQYIQSNNSDDLLDDYSTLIN